MRFIAKLLVAFVGWYVFTTMGVLPTQLQNPLYPRLARFDNFDAQTVRSDCYREYVNPGRNANLSVCATSGLPGVTSGYTAYTDEAHTYIVMDDRLFKCDNEELDFHEIYGKLEPDSTALSVLDGHFLVLGTSQRAEQVQVSDGKKMHTAHSYWAAYARGGRLYERGPFREARGLQAETNFSRISEILYDYLVQQQKGRITTDKFCALLYYQSIGMLCDYYQTGDGYRAVFVDPWRYRVYTADDSGFDLVAELPKTSGYFCRGNEFYYSVNNEVFCLDLDSGTSTVYYSAPDSIRFLNYFVAPVTAADQKSPSYTGQEQVLVLAVVTDSRVIYYSPLETVTGNHDYSSQDFDTKVKGYYVSNYPYRTMLMTFDTSLDDPVSMRKYIARKEGL